MTRQCDEREKAVSEEIVGRKGKFGASDEGVCQDPRAALREVGRHEVRQKGCAGLLERRPSEQRFQCVFVKVDAGMTKFRQATDVIGMKVSEQQMPNVVGT